MRESDLHQDSSFKMAEEEENTALQTASGSSGSGSALAIHDTSDKSNDAEMPCNAQVRHAVLYISKHTMDLLWEKFQLILPL